MYITDEEIWKASEDVFTHDTNRRYWCMGAKLYRDQVQINLRKELIKISEYIRDGWIMDVRYNSDKIINEYLNQKQ